MGEKGELFFMRDFEGWLATMEGVLELENHFALVMVKIGSVKNHQQMLNLGGYFDVEQDSPLVL